MFLSAGNESFEIVHRKLKITCGDGITNGSTAGRWVVQLKSTVDRESLGDMNQEDQAVGKTSEQHKSVVVSWTKRAKAVETFLFVRQNL